MNLYAIKAQDFPTIEHYLFTVVKISEHRPFVIY